MDSPSGKLLQFANRKPWAIYIVPWSTFFQERWCSIPMLNIVKLPKGRHHWITLSRHRMDCHVRCWATCICYLGGFFVSHTQVALQQEFLSAFPFVMLLKSCSAAASNYISTPVANGIAPTLGLKNMFTTASTDDSQFIVQVAGSIQLIKQVQNHPKSFKMHQALLFVAGNQTPLQIATAKCHHQVEGPAHGFSRFATLNRVPLVG